MDNSGVRVRFAPSPTGFLHIGGARTALFNWLFARVHGGKFLLRIEDTDRERSEQRYTDDILESLSWLGLDWDEPPVFQSSRFDRYRDVADRLISEGLAYRCDCSPEALNAIRIQCEKEKHPFRYPGTCREKKRGTQQGVLRVKVPVTGETSFIDVIRSEIRFQNKDLDDWVIMRTDGSPTYNFSVVIDDHDQRITDVLRGDDHINNTPKQMLLYQTLGFEVPHFAHLPMILGPDRTKLSKRHGAGSTLEYRAKGYLPSTIINFLVRLGWSHGDQEIFTVDELKRCFGIEKIGKANAIFNPEKLTWISGHHMKSTPPTHLADYIKRYFPKETEFLWSNEARLIEKGIEIIQGKVKSIPELIAQLDCLFGPDPSYEEGTLKQEERVLFKGILQGMASVLQSSDFSHHDLDTRIKSEADGMKLKLASVAQAMRFAVTGGRVSPGLFEMLEVQGAERVQRRVQRALEFLA